MHDVVATKGTPALFIYLIDITRRRSNPTCGSHEMN
jgi:hypothetical protein